jgi:Mn2+/Fe2+ NRAMP family transporter
MKKPNWFRSVLKLISILRIPLFIAMVIFIVNSTVFFMDISDKISYILYLAQDFSIIFLVVITYVYRHEIYPISKGFKSKKDYITVSKIMTVIFLSTISLNIFFHVLQMLRLQ